MKIWPKISALRHGENTTLTCKLTNKHRRTGLKQISWYKDEILLESIRNPDPDKPLDTLRPLVLKNIGVRDGGNYTCFLKVKLRNIRMYDVSDSTMVERKCTVDWPWWRVSPWLQLQPSPLVFPLPTGHSTGEMSVPQWQRFHTDGLKSVWNLFRISD